MRPQVLEAGDVARAISEIRGIDWSEFATVYGSAESVPGFLIDILSGDRPAALAAADGLWAAVAHQRVLVPNAALPALPFILLALRRDDTRLEVELLDILWGFLVGRAFSSPGSEHQSSVTLPPWFEVLQTEVAEALREFVPRSAGDEVEVIMTGIRAAISERDRSS